MKFKCSVIIDKPIDEVISLFKNPDNLKHWQDGFVSYTHLSGVPGEVGAKSLFVYQQGKNTIELEETIEVNQLPQEFTADYVHKHMSNKMKNHFDSLSEDHTLYEAYIEYYKINFWVIWILARLAPGVFKKQTQKWLDQFKEFAESV